MTRTPESIYQELILIDRSFRDHEATLLPIIKALLAQDPAREPDEKFLQDLRVRLRDHAAALQNHSSLSPFSVMQKYFPYLSGALAVLVIVPVFAFFLMKPGTFPVAPGEPLFGESITSTPPRAFGSLTPAEVPVTPGAEAAMGRSQGGGGGLGSSPSALSVARDEKMIMPYPMVQFDYVYSGEFPELQQSVGVYRRNPRAASLPLSSIGSSLNLGTVNLESFAGASTESITFQQDREFGYQIYVNLRDATISIDAKWDKWPISQCQTEECYRRERITLADIPEDQVLIDIAKAFAEEHGIALSGYGEPEVDNLWRRDYDRAENKEFAYVPETQRVVFPLLLDSKKVTDQSGALYGISMGIHVKHKRVMNVYGITGQSYEKSDYEGISNPAEIQNFLAKLDKYPADSFPQDMKIEKGTVTLGTPTLGFAVHYTYDGMTSQELLVPSLIFPVEKVDAPAEYYFYRQSVVVPLAKDLLKEQNYPPMIPYMEGPAVRGVEDAPVPTEEVKPVEEGVESDSGY